MSGPAALEVCYILRLAYSVGLIHDEGHPLPASVSDPILCDGANGGGDWVVCTQPTTTSSDLHYSLSPACVNQASAVELHRKENSLQAPIQVQNYYCAYGTV